MRATHAGAEYSALRHDCLFRLASLYTFVSVLRRGPRGGSPMDHKGVEMAKFHLIAEAGVASLPGLAYLALGLMYLM